MPIPAAVMETVLASLAAIFLGGTGGDITAARDATSAMLATYNAQTTDELLLAANIVAFSFQALEALKQAAEPDMPLNRVMRLRSGAIGLSRESAKAEHRLYQLQKARQQGIQAQESAPGLQPEPAPKIEKAVALIRDTAVVAKAARANNQTWTQAYEERQRDLRIAAGLKRMEARLAAQANAAIPTIQGRHNPAMPQSAA